MALQLYHDKEAAAASLMNGDGLLGTVIRVWQRSSIMQIKIAAPLGGDAHYRI